MKPNTATRIFLWILSACALVLAVSGIVSYFSFQRAFLGYINQQGVQRSWFHRGSTLRRPPSAYSQILRSAVTRRSR